VKLYRLVYSYIFEELVASIVMVIQEFVYRIMSQKVCSSQTPRLCSCVCICVGARAHARAKNESAKFCVLLRTVAIWMYCIKYPLK